MKMKRIGIEYLIIEKALKDMAELARLNGGEILICNELMGLVENPANLLPLPLDAIRKHVEFCPTCAFVSELWGEILNQRERELELTGKLMAEMTISVEGFEIPAVLQTLDTEEGYSVWHKLTDEELDYYAAQFPVEIQPILRNRKEMKRLYERKSEAKQLELF